MQIFIYNNVIIYFSLLNSPKSKFPYGKLLQESQDEAKAKVAHNNIKTPQCVPTSALGLFHHLVAQPMTAQGMGHLFSDLTKISLHSNGSKLLTILMPCHQRKMVKKYP